MTKQNHLPQPKIYKVLLKLLLTTAISLSLVTALLTIPPLALAVYTSTLVGTTATLVGDITAETVTIDVDVPSGLLRHNRFTAADPGFNSDFDWDTITAGDQTLANVASASVSINAGDGNDEIILGSAPSPASGLAATFTINGGTQTVSDTLTIEDTADTAVRTISVGSNSITIGTLNITNYNNIENLIVNGSNTGNTFNGDTFNLLQSIAFTVTLRGNVGRDTFKFSDGVSLPKGTIDGGLDRDLLDYSLYTTPVVGTINSTINPLTGIAETISIVDFIGGSGNDNVTANASNNVMNGGPGNDTLNGLDGADTLIGGLGNDIMNGGVATDTLTGDIGNDILDGGPGPDTLNGGPGDDTYSFADGWGIDTVTEAAGGGTDSMDFSAVTVPLAITISSVNTTDGINTATHSGNEIETVVSGSNDDTFHVNASALSSHSISIDGGPHPTGDVLNFNAAGHPVITNTTTITAEGQQPLFYTQIEKVNITSTLPFFLPIILK